jgi:Zn-dependent metalloprotease
VIVSAASRLPLLLALALPLALTACADEGAAPDTEAPALGELDALEAEASDQLFALGGPAEAKGVQAARVIKRHIDLAAMGHVKFQQLHRGVPVFGGEAIAHFDDKGRFANFTDDLLADVNVDVRPAYDAAEALDIAASLALPWDAQTHAPTAALWVLRHKGADHLVWRVQQQRTEGVDDPTMPVLFIDAHTGALVWSYENLQTATCTGATNFYGTVSFECYTDGAAFFTEDQLEGVGTFSYANTTASVYYVSSTTAAFPSDQLTKNAVEAQYVGIETVDYFQTTFGRDGIDGAGGPADITTHGVGYIASYTSYSRNYVNAFWDGASMTYGDGDGVNSGSLTVLDVGGHEFTHGVTQYEANLTYSGEPGHLNEAYSDVFGAMVERFARGEDGRTWLVGEDTWTPGTSGDALRYMNDPADDGVSRDYWTSGIGSVDVHYGSGVPNLAFYLLSEGGLHPRGKSTVNVTAIGADDAAAIWYLALTSYMTSSTNFAGARTAQINAATALFGATSQQVQSVTNSWAAVGVGAAWGTPAPTCTTRTYSGSISRAGRSVYAPSSSGVTAGTTPMSLALTGPSSANFNLALERKSGSRWSAVASSTGSTSTEAISYTGTSGTYRATVNSVTGTGSFSLTWCY